MTSRRAPGASSEAYRADSEQLTRFVDRSRSYRAELDAILLRILVARRLVVAAVGDGPPSTGAPALVELLDGVDASTALADSVRRDLLDALVDGMRPVLRRAVLDGRLPPPDDEVRDRVLAAVVDGRGPGDVGIDPAYFPAAVMRHRSLTDQIDRLEAERDRADGLPLVWWDDDDLAVAELDGRLDRMRDRRAELSEHGIEVDGSIDRLEAAALVAETLGGSEWEGRVYADAFAEHRRRGLAGGGPVSGGQATLVEIGGFEAEFDHLAERVEADDEVAIGFYRELGPAAAADLPTFVIGAAGDDVLADARPVLEQLAGGLAAATRLDRVGATPLGFDGGDLLTQAQPDTAAGVIGWSPALLFTAGSFDGAFLADATIAALALGADGDPRGHAGRFGWSRSSAGLGAVAAVHPGEDPRNLLLSRAAEDSEVTRLVVAGLTADSEALGLLLRPSVPFTPAVVPGLDPYPITAFLAAAAADGDTSMQIVRAVAGRAADPGLAGESAIGDPGTAAGLDLLLGVNASIMVDHDDLLAVGLALDGGGPRVERSVEPAQWRSVVEEVRRWGRGDALALATADLTTRAIGGAIDADGHLHVDRVAPFAQLAGRAEAEAHHARLAYAAGLDDEARAWNRQASRTAAVATTALGFVPVVGSASIPAGLGWTFLFDGRPTDAELREHRDRWAVHYEHGRGHPWTAAVAQSWLDRALAGTDSAEIELVVPGGGRQPVELRSAGQPGRYRWRHPETGAWVVLDTKVESNVLALAPHASDVPLRRAIDGAVEIDEEFRDGIAIRRLPTASSGHPTVDNDREAIMDAAWTDRWFGAR